MPELRKLTPTEIADIKKEINKQGNFDTALKFCLGHHKLDYWHFKARETFEAVKRQVLSS